MVAENRLSSENLIQPLFLIDGTNVKSEVSSLPGNFRFSSDTVLPEIESCLRVGVKAFILFPSIAEDRKDKVATYSYDPANFYLKAATEIKQTFPECCLISDVAMDPYSSDGHDGLVDNGVILNDETLPILSKMAVAQAQAGFDIIGPSDMMDGREGAIRSA